MADEHIEIKQPVAGSALPKPATASRRTRVRVTRSHIVLAIAVVLVLIVSALLVQGVSGMIGQFPLLFNQNLAQVTPTASTPNGTIDARPHFPTPGGGQGGQQSSLPPAYAPPTMATGAQPTPTVTTTATSIPDVTATPTTIANDTPTPVPTATGITQGGTLSLQITSIPPNVGNNSIVTVLVQSSLPNITIQLQVTYTASPFFYSTSGTADNNGQANIAWHIHIGNGRKGQATAQVVATARDQNGQQVDSQSVLVTIMALGG